MINGMIRKLPKRDQTCLENGIYSELKSHAYNPSQVTLVIMFICYSFTQNNLHDNPQKFKLFTTNKWRYLAFPNNI